MKVRILAAAAAQAGAEVAGLAVSERTRRVLTRAGCTFGEAVAGTGSVLLVAGDAAIEPRALEALIAAASDEVGAMIADNAIEAPAALIVPASDPDARTVTSAGELGAVAMRLRDAGRLRLVPSTGALCQRIRSAADARRIERHMLAALVQPTDGFFARHFDRKLSSRLSPALVRLGVRPNTITLVATLIGLVGAAMLAAPSHALQVAGALLFVVSTILDGCDGEVARLSVTSSAFGRRLDLIGDNVVNAAVFIAIGWSAISTDARLLAPSLVWIALGGLTLATVAGFSFSRWIDRSGRKAEFYDWYESLASRDFAYFVLLLAAVGRLHWFVWCAAIGTYAFVVVLAVIRLRAAREPAAPLGEGELT
ncbi:MAG: CDP-alcohol phosphatidyltransferase family protein [Deltaproteobacteria bacterium]|nr:CDP-alcohol phosphatidyltransferase family protein [Deltaproteobacteria bacterium]